MLNIVNNRGMVGICAGGPKGLVALGVCCQIPVDKYELLFTGSTGGKSEVNRLPEANRLVLTTRGEVAGFMRIPAEPEALCLMTQELHLGIHISSRLARVLRAIPDHHPAVRAHGRDDIRVLWLVSCLVHLSLVINLLGNVELDLHLWLLRASTITSNLTPFLIIVLGVGSIGVG